MSLMSYEGDSAFTREMEDGPETLRDGVVNSLRTDACNECIRVPYTLHLMPKGGAE
jgi:hypothetical protein